MTFEIFMLAMVFGFLAVYLVYRLTEGSRRTSVAIALGVSLLLLATTLVRTGVAELDYPIWAVLYAAFILIAGGTCGRGFIGSPTRGGSNYYGSGGSGDGACGGGSSGGSGCGGGGCGG